MTKETNTMQKPTLNIGCGSDPWGDVRVDVKRHYWREKGFRRESTLNVVADAQHLPFVNKSFDKIRAYHVLEHIPDCFSALSEFCRVSRTLDITIPVKSSIPKQNLFMFPSVWSNPTRIKLTRTVAHEHIWQFDIEVLKRVLVKLGFANVKIDAVKCSPFNYLVTGRKGKLFKPLTRLWRRPFSWRILAYESPNNCVRE